MISFFLIEAIPVWQLKLPKLGSESNIRLVNITKDAHLDIIMGFGTGADGYDVPEFVCDIYFNGQVPCFGGVLAIDGKTGKSKVFCATFCFAYGNIHKGRPIFGDFWRYLPTYDMSNVL